MNGLIQRNASFGHISLDTRDTGGLLYTGTKWKVAVKSARPKKRPRGLIPQLSHIASPLPPKKFPLNIDFYPFLWDYQPGFPKLGSALCRKAFI
jgi:hypothetical protein